MAKTPKPKPSDMGNRMTEETGPAVPAPIPLSHEERVELRKLFASDLYRKAFHNARLMKPSAFAGTEALNGPLGGQIANNRLHQMQGWDQFEAALAVQALDPKPERKPLEETFPADPFFQSSDPNYKPAPAKPSTPKKT